MRIWILIGCCLVIASGCAAVPSVREQPRFHNPFPQLGRVAIVPMNNQSDVATLNMDQVTNSYYGELQKIRGFEVVPVGVVLRVMEVTRNRAATPEEIRELGNILGVDAVVIGSVTDYTPYYPKRMTLAVNWYAVNPGFHPIPPGYGLPWGTAAEEFIPESHLWEAEFALAREQLETQTPLPETATPDQPLQPPAGNVAAASTEISAEIPPHIKRPEPIQSPDLATRASTTSTAVAPATAAGLPADWPDPRGFVPPVPQPERPPLVENDRPIISQIRSYHENDSDFTTRAQLYFHFLDDARNGGWQGFLDRSDDFIRFCCYSHITEMLSLRGGAGESRVVIRWSESR